MTHELDQLRRHGEAGSAIGLDHDLNRAPGRTARTDHLVGRVTAHASGIVLRKASEGARDGNGVAAGAEAAVASATSSLGKPLPDDVRARFESSTGADLSRVRVHTGAESAEAAGAVGAKAYTIGQDIHFAAGNYAPSDPAGLHLLAHEVAHTVQQHGGPTTTQCKLEVSTPGDAAEVEADRAADAMVSGALASIAGGGSGLGRKVMRETPGAAAKGPDDKAGSKAAGHWQPPFNLPACDDRPGACVALVDMAKMLQDLKTAGFDECQPVIDKCNAQANALAGSDALTAEEADKLSALGVVAKASHDLALNDMKQKISAELAKWSGGDDFSEAEAKIADALHNSFMGDSGKNKLTQLKDLSAKIQSLASKVQKYSGWAGMAKGQVASAQKFEDLSKKMEGFNTILGGANDVVNVAESIATLAGKINEKPGGTQNDIAKIRAGLNIVDFAISKSKVPLIGDLWKGVIKPCADLALDKVGALDKLAESIVKEPKFDEWWQEAKGGGGPPQLFSSPFDKAVTAKYFPGGQPMLDFMWQVMRGGVSAVPPGVESYFLKFKDQFNAGHADSDSIQEQSNWQALHPSTWGNKATSPNLLKWLNTNKDEAWSMIYGSLPHP